MAWRTGREEGRRTGVTVVSHTGRASNVVTKQQPASVYVLSGISDCTVLHWVACMGEVPDEPSMVLSGRPP